MNSKLKGLCKAFFCGSNTSCRQHIRQHYTIYQERCREQNLIENHQAIPPHILKEREARAASAKQAKKQSKLDGLFKEKQKQPAGFSREGALEAVAKFIACDDQVSENYYVANVMLKELIVVGGCRQSSF